MSARVSGARLALAVMVVFAASAAPLVGGQQLTEPEVARIWGTPDERWTPSRTSDGQPDIQGWWVPVVAGTFSFEDIFNDRQGAILSARGGRQPRRPLSRVVDPPDGKIPYQPWALAKRDYLTLNENRATKPWHIDTQARCALPGVLRQVAYNANLFLQIPGYVIMTQEATRAYRVIPLGGGSHIPDHIKLWGADSRGRWEGQTLVVDNANFNAKNRLNHAGDFISPNTHIVERFHFVDATHMIYEATVEDPTMFTRPWKIAIPHVAGVSVRSSGTGRSVDSETNHSRPSDYEPLEGACHEGERSVDIMLSK